jgi:hypothetical protein
MTYYNDYRSGIRYKLGISWVHEIPANYRNITMIQLKKKELYYLKEKSSYLLVHLSEVFEKRVLHFLPYFS